MKREERWSGAVAVGSHAFVEKVGCELGIRAKYREVDDADGKYALPEPRGAYTNSFGAENSALRLDYTILWVESPVSSET